MHKILKDYKEYLTERHGRRLWALDMFADVLETTLKATGLPEPQFQARPGSSRTGLVTVVWKQEVSAPRPGGATTVTLRIEMTLHDNGLAFHVRDPRNADALQTEAHLSITNPDFQLSRLFLQRATDLASDPKVRMDKWEATLFPH